MTLSIRSQNPSALASRRDTNPRTAAAVWSVYALTYGFLAGLRKAQFTYGTGFDEELPPVPLQFYLLRAGNKNVLVDVGCDAIWASAKDVTDYISPPALLQSTGVSIDQIDDVVLTHLHWDHASGISAFPSAKVHLQRRELDGWSQAFKWGEDFRWVHHGRVTPELLRSLTSNPYLRLIDDRATISPGIECHLAHGHTFGNQIVVVQTPSGPVVLASDAVFLEENIDRMVPLGNGLDQIAMLRSIALARDLAGPSGIVVPGHDPSTQQLFSRGNERVLRMEPALALR